MRGNSPPVYGPFDLALAEVAYRGLNGVYSVFARFGPYRVPVDVGESTDVGDRLRNHDRKPDWFARIHGLLMRGVPVTLEVYATPTPASAPYPKGYRMWTEYLWRYTYKLMGYALCGQRP